MWEKRDESFFSRYRRVRNSNQILDTHDYGRVFLAKYDGNICQYASQLAIFRGGIFLMRRGRERGRVYLPLPIYKGVPTLTPSPPFIVRI